MPSSFVKVSPGQRDTGVELAALVAASMLASLGFWFFFARAHYAPVLSVGGTAPTPDETLLVAWVVSAETLLFLVPGLVVAFVALWRRKDRIARFAFMFWACLVLEYEALDLQVYGSFGRHLSELIGFLFLPGAAQIAGGVGHWLGLLAGYTSLTVALTLTLTLSVRLGFYRLAPKLSRDFRHALGGLLVLAIAAAFTLPAFVEMFFRRSAVFEGLHAQLIWAPSTRAHQRRFQDPNWAMLDAGLRGTYERLFPLLFSPHPLRFKATPKPAAPNVVMIVLESFRADSLTPERMPRLYAWAQKGLVAKEHYAGSIFSEAGMFTLLYGTSPLIYHSTLDAHQAPTWCELAHALGMSCNYYSGQPKEWLRLEEFLNPRVVDHYVHDDKGDWPHWDRTALDNAVTAIHTDARPSISTIYLMSTHFEYQYPPSYERHLPIMAEAKWPKTDVVSLDMSKRVPLTNRYLNSLAFSDDLVLDAIEKLDPQRTIILVTGDHGESLGDDEHFGHAYSFSNAVIKVPLILVGPGIAAGTREAISTHADIVRTLAHLLGANVEGPDPAQDLVVPHDTRSGLLLAHCSYDHASADAVLIRGDRRIRLTLGLRKPSVEIRGPENELGRGFDTYAINKQQVEGLLETFESELDRIWKTAAPTSAN